MSRDSRLSPTYLPDGVDLTAPVKSIIIWSCYSTVDSEAERQCLLRDSKGRACGQKFSASTKSTNLGIHITSKHVHVTALIDAMQALDKGTAQKKRSREENKVVELPSKVAKLNNLPNSCDNQSKIDDYVVSSGSSLRAELNEALALMISVHSLPMRLVESEYFQTVLDLYRRSAKHVKQVDSRQHIIKCEQDLFQSLKQQVNQSLKSSAYPITLAFDGWQNTNHLHVQNIMGMSSSSTVFLKSDLTTHRATADELYPFIESVIDDLINEKIEIGSIVADNASVNGKIAKKLRVKYPWILRLPCASHTLQLCIVRLFEQDSVADELKLIVRTVVKAITNSNIRLNEFIRVQGDEVHLLSKPQKTRWSSYHRASKSVLELRPFVELALRRNAADGDHPVLSSLTTQFWNQLNDLVTFLEPFSLASDIIQSDHATLLDVHTQFSTLYSACASAPLSLTHGAAVMQVAIQQHWRKNINQEAVYMAAQFAHEPNSDLFDDRVKLDAPDWFCSWASELWFHHESLKSGLQLIPAQKADRVQEIAAIIQKDHSSFLTNQFPYSRAKLQIENNRPIPDPSKPALYAQFDALTPWLRLESANLSEGKEFVHAVVTLLSMNCTEASVERGFSLQKLTHSLLMNRKHASTVERQMYIKSNHRVMRQMKVIKRVSMRATSHFDASEHDSGLNDYGSDTDVEIFDSTDEDSDDESNQDEGDDDRELMPAAASQSINQPQPPAVHSQAHANQVRSSRVRPRHRQASLLQPARRTWTMVDGLTHVLHQFCENYIKTNELRLPSPFANRGASKLRAAMEADPALEREQATDAQRHIIFLLQQAQQLSTDVPSAQV